jgi:mandelate racemase
MDWGAGVVEQPIQIKDGFAITPDRPGTGISWDEKAVERYQV